MTYPPTEYAWDWPTRSYRRIVATVMVEVERINPETKRPEVWYRFTAVHLEAI